MSSFVTIQNSLGSGELTPSLYGRTDLAKWHQGTSTCRNFFVDYRGGISSRPGFAYVGTCPQAGGAYPPRDIQFQFSLTQGYVLEFGDNYMCVKQNGAYVTLDPIIVLSVSTAGVFTTLVNHNFGPGSRVFNVGNTGFSNLTWIVSSTPSATTFTVTDLFGNPVTTAIASGNGTIAAIFSIATPYFAIDLPYLKYTQSADTMTLTCVNFDSGVEYPSYELKRFASNNWTLTQDSFAATITPPTGVTATAQSSTTLTTFYSYLVTAISDATGEESVASIPCYVENNDISINQGSNKVSWNPVEGASAYNVYSTVPSYNQQVPVGVLYGYLGTSLGTSFVDSNIIPDFTLVPPVHNNPFAFGQILGVTVSAGGSGYTQATIGYTITSVLGTGFVGTPIVDGGVLVGFLVSSSGANYAPTDTITITDSGSGTGAVATLLVGPQKGTYPSAVAYYQQRRVYAATLNNPDTYYFSQPGNFLNMDSSIPVTSSDAIVGTPWAQQVNGIQYMVAMPGGLVILTGKGAWQLNGGASADLTPSNQIATPQAYNGCHNHVEPQVINYDILYVQAKGSIVRDLSYNFFVNIYTGTDLTVLSNHLFNFHQIQRWCWAEEPFKLVWLVRDDGVLLSLTYLKEQDVYAWTRHDTNGLFQCVCSISEQTPAGATSQLPAFTDAVYTIVKRYVPKYNKWMYYSERLDNRIWNNVEDAFCVDAGLSAPITFPDTSMQASAITGDSVTFSTPVGVFSPANIGDVIRVGGGKATITSVNGSIQAIGIITQDITLTVPNDPNNLPLPANSGEWSIATPITTVSGLNHLEGMTVSILADGSVVPQQVVTNGSITLPHAASQVVVGLPYICQAQSLYMDHPSQGNTDQNRRKTISAVGIRVEQTRGLQIGADQIDASTQPNYATIPWTNMVEIKERSNQINAGTAIPLYTGDHYRTVTSSWDVKGQIAAQQIYPLPATILAFVGYWEQGDDK